MTDTITRMPPSDSSSATASVTVTEAEAREVAEAARETTWEAPSFVRELFEGSFRFDLIHPYPESDPADLAESQKFFEHLSDFLRTEVDSDLIDREGKIPEHIVAGLRRLGAFGIKVPKEYGGLGLPLKGHTSQASASWKRNPSALHWR